LVFSVIVPVEAAAEVGANFALKVLVAPAPMLSGVARPLMVKAEPEMLAEEIVSVALPVFFKLTVRELLLPTVTLPKATGDGVAVSEGVGAAVPVPVSDTAIVDGEALLEIVRVPVEEVAPVGAKCALKIALAPALTLSVVGRPLMEKPLPEMLQELIFNVEVLVFVSVTACVLLVPIVTFPNATGDGVTLSWADEAPVPVPVSEKVVVGEPDALLEIERPPVAEPDVVGAKCTLKMALAPALTLSVVGRPLMEKPLPEILHEVTFSVEVPVFLSVTGSTLELPTVTFPNETGEGEMLI
jgi:hypothetical protein